MIAMPTILYPQERPVSPQAPTSHDAAEDLILDFSAVEQPRWLPVNDGVMGGVSEGALQLTEGGTGRFSGFLSLENNGGFASARIILPSQRLAAYRGLRLRVKGDGRRYQVRLRVGGQFDGVAYKADFRTRAGEWEELTVPFHLFRATFRGRILDSMPPVNPARIQQLGFMIADKTEGPFSLEIAWIRGVSRTP